MGNTQADSALIRVEAADIEGLTEEQLPQLLKILLDSSALLMGVPLGCWHVNARTKAPDGGIDGSIAWDVQPQVPIPAWFPGSDVIFQCKARRDFSETECGQELLTGKTGPVKPAIAEVLSRGGKYILVATPSWSPPQRDSRLKNMVSQLSSHDASLAGKTNVEIYDAGDITAWANRFPAAIVQVLSWRGKHIPFGLVNLESLARDPRYAIAFHPSPQQRDAVDMLRRQVTQEKVWHIVGPAGIGKTRVAVEAFRTLDDRNSSSVPGRTALYVDASSIGSESLHHSWSWIAGLEVPCVFIVGNCSPADYAWLAPGAATNAHGLALVALSSETCDFLPRPTALMLDQMPEDVMKQILTDCGRKLSPLDVDFAIRQAQGLPGVALAVARELVKTDYSVTAVIEDSSIASMWLRAKAMPDSEYNCLAAISLFTRVGFQGGPGAELQSLANCLCRNTGQEYLVKLTGKFIESGFLKKADAYVAVWPRLMAQRIAYDWWSRTDPSIVPPLMQALMPSLLVSFCERLGQLSFSDRAKEAVRNLCGPSGPLSNADYLATTTGARLLSAVAECNPTAAANSLHRAFASFTPDRARTAMESGEALVEAMGKLCWWSECFDEAAPILLLFAAGERTLHHEYVARQYLDLFRLAVPGTQKPLLQRLPVLDDALSSDFEACRILAVRALCNALTTGFCTRWGNIQSQGGRRPQLDYRPQSRQEILDYWQQITTRLETSLKSSEPAVQEAAATGFIGRLAGLVEDGFQDVADSLVRAIIRGARRYLPTLHNHVLELLDSPREFDKSKLQDWLDAMTPMSLIERIHMDVLDAPQFCRSKDSESAVEARLVDLVAYCKDHVNELADAIPVLLEATETAGRRILFGQKLGSALSDPWITADSLLTAIRAGSQPASGIDVGVLGGLLAELRTHDNGRVEAILDTIRQDRTLVSFLVVLTACSNAGLVSVQRCVDSAMRHEIEVSSLAPLTYPYVLERLDPRDVAHITESLHSLGTDEALRVSLVFICMRCMTSGSKLAIEMRFALRPLIMDHRLPKCLRNGQSLDWYWWTQAAVWLLHEQDDQELAADVVQQLLSGFDTDDLEPWDYQVDAVAAVLLQEYWGPLWTHVRATAIAKGSVGTERARSAFAGRREDHQDFELGFSQVTMQEAREWCTADHVHAPTLLLQLVPVAVRDPETKDYSWNKVARYIVDEYGQDLEVQVALAGRLNDLSGWGNPGNSVRRTAQLYKQLETSPSREVRRWARSVRDQMEAEGDRLDLQVKDYERGAGLL